MSTQTDTTNDDQATAGTPQDTGATPGATGTQQTPQADAQPQSQAQPEGDQTDPLGKLRKEAAGHRVAAKEARAEADDLRTERDALVARLSAAQDSILADRLKPHAVSLDSLVAAGHRDAVFNDDGTLNEDALRTATADAAARFGRTGPDPMISRHLGRETPPGGGSMGGWMGLINGL